MVVDKMISVIVPVYNVEKYLCKCIDSILVQTYSNLQIILVDDGSTDNSGYICDEYAKKDSRIEVIHKKNGGLSSARNAGLDICTGEYIAFIDSDDYIDENMFMHMLNQMQTDNSDMSICNVKYVYESSIEPFHKESPIKDEVLTVNEAFDKLCKSDYYYYIIAVNKLYKKYLWQDIRFPVGKLHEDEFVAHHIFYKCKAISTLKNEYYFYLQRNNSIMNQRKYNIKHLDGAEAKVDRYRFLKEKGYQEAAKASIIGAYYIVLDCIRRTEIRYNKKRIQQVLKLVFRELGNDLRKYKLLLLYFKKVIREFLAKVIYLKPIERQFRKSRNKRRVVLMATPVHGNLGDQAIVYAEKKLLKEIYPNNPIIEVDNYTYLKFTSEIIPLIKKDDIIIIDGGGNLGTLWPNEDEKISGIINQFHSNKIVIFPQTMYYGTSSDDLERLSQNQKVYKAASDLTIMLRDSASFEFFKEKFSDVNSILVPDIVLSLNENKRMNRTDQVLLCFRSDREKVIDDRSAAQLKSELNTIGYDWSETTTVISKRVTKRNRNKELKRKWIEFSTAKIVITDRLHALIFAVITGTPCIALNNKSKKVEGTYKLLKEVENLYMVKDINDIIPLVLNLELSDVTSNKFLYPIKIIRDIMGENQYGE